jgi:hypothetical protein
MVGFLSAGSLAGAEELPALLGHRDGEALRVERAIAPGVVHLYESRAKGPLTINAVTVDLTRPDLVLEAEKANDRLRDRETMQDMVQRLYGSESRPIVGLNGDFWGMASFPLSAFVDEGILWKFPHGHGLPDAKIRGAFVFGAVGKAAILVPRLSFAIRPVVGSGEPLSITQLNPLSPETSTVAYNWAWGAKAPGPTDGRRQFVLELLGDDFVPNASFSAIRSPDSETSVTLDRSTLVLHVSAPPAWLTDLRPDQGVGVSLKLEGFDGPVQGLVGGGPRLLVNGKADVEAYAREEGVGEDFVQARHPRTAIGIKADGKTVVMVTVDGRQPGRSTGINLTELARLMQELGCVEALNFDGGGSTSMVVGGRLANHPSDGDGARPVSNGLLLRRMAPLGPLARLEIAPRELRLAPDTRLPFTVFGFSAEGEEVPVDAASIAFGGTATLSGSTVRGTEPSTGTLTATVGSVRGEWPYEIVTVAADDGLSVQPAGLLLAPGESAKVIATLRDGAGKKLPSTLQLERVEVPDFASWDVESGRVTGNREGRGTVRVTVGSASQEIPLAVGTPPGKVVLPMEKAPRMETAGARWFGVVRAEVAGPVPQLDRTTFHGGEASWRVEYKLLPGGTSKVSLPVRAELPSEALALGVWVRGDGNKHWLRATIRDEDGDRYYLNLTDSETGIDWKDQWKLVSVPFTKAIVLQAKEPQPAGKVTVEEIYFVQTVESAKRDGTLWFDDLTAMTAGEE